MTSKKKKRSTQKREPRTPAKFTVGTQVRVEPATTDPDFPDIPLGGWVGTIREVDERSDSPMYLIEWNQHTLDHMHPVYRKRCERDGLELGSMWLGEGDIEPDTGEVAVIEQLAQIRTRPLNEKDQDDRIRAILGLTSDDPLPEVDEETVRKYHSYLVNHLSFPFAATFSQETVLADTTYPVTVVGLLDAEGADEIYGLLCETRQGSRHVEMPLGEIEAKKGEPNRRLIKDYSYWFWNWR